MKISAEVENRAGEYKVRLNTGGRERSIELPPKPDGQGCGVNGGELLFLALATCYCNDLYREAAKRKVMIESVAVQVSGEFGGEGEPANGIRYAASVVARAPKAEIEALLRHTDSVAEIHNTVRRGAPVVLSECVAREAEGW
jgi:organic hydroperoxide reductase OsmC/OhrA